MDPNASEGWRTAAENRWRSVGENYWRIVGENAWRTMGENLWRIIGRKVTGIDREGSFLLQFCEGVTANVCKGMDLDLILVEGTTDSAHWRPLLGAIGALPEDKFSIRS